MSIGLTCGHLQRGVCPACAGQTRRLALQHAQDTASAMASADYARGVADERARVVADLRKRARAVEAFSSSRSMALLVIAQDYEAGEHEEGA